MLGQEEYLIKTFVGRDKFSNSWKIISEETFFWENDD